MSPNLTDKREQTNKNIKFFRWLHFKSNPLRMAKCRSNQFCTRNGIKPIWCLQLSTRQFHVHPKRGRIQRTTGVIQFTTAHGIFFDTGKRMMMQFLMLFYVLFILVVILILHMDWLFIVPVYIGLDYYCLFRKSGSFLYFHMKFKNVRKNIFLNLTTIKKKLNQTVLSYYKKLLLKFIICQPKKCSSEFKNITR